MLLLFRRPELFGVSVSDEDFDERIIADALTEPDYCCNTGIQEVSGVDGPGLKAHFF